MYPQCECDSPTSSCPRYGWMKGHKWRHCQGVGVTPEEREKYLAQYETYFREPSLLTKAVNLAKATAQHALAGFPTTTDDQLEERLSICKSCINYTQQGTCQLCGCYMSIKAKWLDQDCPINLWPKLSLPVIQKEGGCGCSSS